MPTGESHESADGSGRRSDGRALAAARRRARWSPAAWPGAAAGGTERGRRVGVAGRRGATLRIGWTADPDNLSPFIGVETAASEVLYLTYDRLFGFGLDGKPIPQLATELPTQENGGISADGLTWTVHIRPGVKWQDGQPLTAADVAFSYNLIIDNKLTSFLQAVKDIKHAEAVDDTTVRFTMSAPKADMLYAVVYIIPEHIWGKVKVPTLERSYANKTPIVGSGPFQVTYYKRGDYTKLVRNPGYWGNDVPGWGRPKVDAIIFQAYTNPDTMTQDLRTGAVDAAQGVPSAQFPGLQSESGSQGDRLQLLQLGLRRLQLLRQPALGRQPGAPRPRVPGGARLRHRPRAHHPARVQRPRQARLHDDQRRHVARPRLPLGAAGRRQAAVRPRQGQGTAGRGGLQGHATATASARTSRASPSRCGCGRWPSRPRPRARASSSPAGSGTSASRSASRSWTTAWPATRCTPGRATTRRPTTT